MNNFYFDDVFSVIFFLDESFLFEDTNFNYVEYSKFKDLSLMDNDEVL